jgi:hypothetical protein
MKTTTILLLFLLATSLAFSQTTESINTDRPGQTTNPHTVGVGVSQIQFGINYYDPNISNNNFVFRHGITEKFELNGGFKTTLDFKEETRHGNDGLVNGTQFGINYFNLGARYNLLQRDDYTPGIGIQGTAYIEAGGYYDSDVSSFQFLVSADQKIIGDLSLGGNLIMNNGADLSLTNFYYTAYTSYSYNDFSFLLEMYGRLDLGFETFWDFGVSYQTNQNLIFDINYGQRSLIIVDYSQREFPFPFHYENFWNAEIGLTYRLPKN